MAFSERAILAVWCLRIATPEQDYLSPSNSPNKSMKFHVPALALTLALTSLPAASGLTQNAAGGKAPVASSLLDNEQIRVREVRFAPGAKQPAAARPNTFFYALTDGSLVFSPPGRTAYELTFKAGEALWLPSQETSTANEGDKEVRALMVELKGRAPAGKASKKGTKGGKKAGKKAAKN